MIFNSSHVMMANKKNIISKFIIIYLMMKFQLNIKEALLMQKHKIKDLRMQGNNSEGDVDKILS